MLAMTPMTALPSINLATITVIPKNITKLMRYFLLNSLVNSLGKPSVEYAIAWSIIYTVSIFSAFGANAPNMNSDEISMNNWINKTAIPIVNPFAICTTIHTSF